MSDRLNWGIIGCGSIAKRFALGLEDCKRGRLSAVASRSVDKAKEFAEETGAGHAFGSYPEMLASDTVDAVYIAVPHTHHAEWAVKAAEAGKHILCEKPLTVHHGEAMQVIEAAYRNGVFLMEAFMYRCHPQTMKIVELIREGAIGEIFFIEVQNGFRGKFDPASRIFDPNLAGGGIMDMGGYPVSFARLVAGAAAGKEFLDPVAVRGSGRMADSGVDGVAAATLRFPGGCIAQVATGVQVKLKQGARIFGSEGRIEVPEPWQPDRYGPACFLLYRGDADEPEEISIPAPDIYGLEADVVATSVAAEKRQAPPPAMTWDDSLGNMKALDEWRAAIGLEYEFEKAKNLTHTVSGRPLKVRGGGQIPKVSIAGLGKQAARLFMGAAQLREPRTAYALFDDYFERGGNAFDTGHIYGNSEEVLGQWIANRGIREEVIILDKSAHTPRCTPEWFEREFTISLERLQTDYTDIYMLHRDNPDIPVGEFMDAMDRQVKAGRIRVLGVSNWSPERVDAANEYARQKGLTEITAVSNNMSLARMVAPPWPGALSAWEPAVRRWHTERNMILIPWSSQAKGFFTRADPEEVSDEDLVRCWYSDDNFLRFDRARDLAEKKGTTAIAISLAWVLHQEFPVFPLIGPRRIIETRTSLEALDVTLTADEVRWLNLEENT